MNACPKPQRVQSKALTQSARGRPCTVRWTGCTYDPETTVLAHLRGPWALGIGTKPPDFFAIYACEHCHRQQENRLVPWEELMRALCETQTQMAREGLITVRGAK